MAKSCPDCGAEVEYQARAVEVLEGTCSGCGHSMVVVAPSVAASEGDRAAAAVSSPAAPCWECGESLRFTVNSDKSVDAACASCNTVTHLAQAVPVGPDGEDDGDDEEDDDDVPARPPRGPRPMGMGDRGPPRGPGRFRDDRRGPRRSSDDGDRPPARPCRQCGGPLQFSQNDDGTVTGTCGSCGNTFTMRPREERPNRGGFERRQGWGGRPRSPPFTDRRRSYSRPRGDDDDRPRRRRRDD